MEISEEMHTIELKDIKVSKSNVRSTDRKAGLDDLMKSIAKHGLLQPVILKGSYGTPPYELIVGQRRFLAHKGLRRKIIKAVFAGDMSDTEAKILSLAENVHRKELNHADKAKAITELYLHYQRNTQSVAKELGLSPQTVREYIKIEEQATPKMKDLWQKRKITKQDMKRVIDAAQGDAQKADRLAEEIIKISKYEKDRAVSYAKSHSEASADQIIEEGKKSKLETTIILNLSPEIDKALDRAKKKLLMNRESIAAKAISEWLERNGFLRSRD